MQGASEYDLVWMSIAATKLVTATRTDTRMSDFFISSMTAVGDRPFRGPDSG